MAIFTKNKNPKALISNQKLFKICCEDTTTDPCCYDTEPRPVCDCNFNLLLFKNGAPITFPGIINISQSGDLPATIDVVVNNKSSCPIKFTRIGASTSSPFFIFLFNVDPVVIPANTQGNLFSFQISGIAGQGSYLVDYGFSPDCTISFEDKLEIMITA